MKPTLPTFILIGISVLLYNCARQTTPEGGPKDTTKPSLIELKSTPKDNQKNFKGKSIELYFTEDVKLKDPKEEILITPSPGKETKFTAIKNKITIEPENRWKDSTTYNIMFREAIQDVTESNVTEELHLAFSTGPIIDSLSLEGTIVESTTDKTPEKITVALYTSDTFNIFNNTSTYFTKTDKIGHFKITNLKKGNYYLYAYDDKNKNLKVESTNEKYAFKGSAIVLDKNKDSLRLQLVKMDSRPIKLNSNRSNNKTTTLRFNKSLTNYSITENSYTILNTFGDNQTEITFYYDESMLTKDSLKLRVKATDSLLQIFDSLLYIKKGESKAIKTTYSISTEPPTLDYTTGLLEIKGKTNIPTKRFNTDSLYIKLDSLTKITFPKESVTYNETTKRFKISTLLDTAILVEKITNVKDQKQKEAPSITKDKKLKIGKGFAVSIYNDSSKQQTITLPSKITNNTGTLQVEVITKKIDYHIQLLSANNQLISEIENKEKHTFSKLLGGEYKIRVFIDSNKNGIWDAGNIYKKQEPEQVYYYIGKDSKTNIPLRENWEVGPLTIKF